MRETDKLLKKTFTSSCYSTWFYMLLNHRVYLFLFALLVSECEFTFFGGKKKKNYLTLKSVVSFCRHLRFVHVQKLVRTAQLLFWPWKIKTEFTEGVLSFSHNCTSFRNKPHQVEYAMCFSACIASPPLSFQSASFSAFTLEGGTEKWVELKLQKQTSWATKQSTYLKQKLWSQISMFTRFDGGKLHTRFLGFFFLRPQEYLYPSLQGQFSKHHSMRASHALS